MQTLAIPAGATNIQFSVKGAGGGGGSADNVGNQQIGQNGHLVAESYSTSGVTLNVYVGGGGAAGSTTASGAGGGWGYHPGGNGGNGGDEGDGICWAYGGAGGGGSSAILSGATVIAESAGGAGGRSSDWDGYEMVKLVICLVAQAVLKAVLITPALQIQPAAERAAGYPAPAERRGNNLL